MDENQTLIGDAERDAAVRELQQHHIAGRLTLDEFNERMAQALAARRVGELGALFTDLPTDWRGHAQGALDLATPRPKGAEMTSYTSGPGTLATPSQSRSTLEKLAIGLNGSLFPIVLVIQFATGFAHWWLWLLPLAVSPLLLSLAGDADEDTDEDRDEDAEPRTKPS